MGFCIVEEVLLSNIWKPKTSGLGEHDFQFNVPPPQINSGDVLAIHHRSTNSEIGHVAHSGRATLKNNTSRISTSATRKFISSSFAGGRWDRGVLTKKSEYGNPHTSELRGIWKGWDLTIRTITHTTKNPMLNFERDYSSRSLIGLPPPI